MRMSQPEGLQKPLPRQARPFVGHGLNYGDGNTSYLNHDFFAPGHHSLVRAGAVLDRDLRRLFDFIEPCQENADCFSHQTFGQLGRAAMEVEALLSLSLDAAGLRPSGNPTMRDYRQLEDQLKLSQYRVRVPVWKQGNYQFRPFESWEPRNADDRKAPPWWNCYNHAKHDRSRNFHEASFEAAVQATAAAVVCLFAQVAGRALEVSAIDPFGSYIDNQGWLGGKRLFELKPPTWLDNEKYGFDKAQLPNSSLLP